jgi:hypothetical protein
MKVTQQEVPKPFTPVVLTLITQDEVDQMYALGNHGRLSLAIPVLFGIWSELDATSASNEESSGKHLCAINKLLK